MHGSDSAPPYGLLIFGAILLCAGIGGTLTGVSVIKGITYRREQPKLFWWSVTLQFLCGLWLIGEFIAEVYGR